MTTNNSEVKELHPGSILSYARDLPNICSLTGLACTIIAIYCSVIGIYAAAMIGMIWAVAFDWADGLIARKMKGRTGSDRVFGGQLDVLIDIVSYGVAPAILLLSYGQFELIYLPGAFLIVAASALRLSYFSTFGLADGKSYTGLALDNNSIILVGIFLFEGFINQSDFSIVLYISSIVLAILNVSQIKTPKLSGNPINVFILAGYTFLMTAIYSLKLL